MADAAGAEPRYWAFNAIATRMRRSGGGSTAGWRTIPCRAGWLDARHSRVWRRGSLFPSFAIARSFRRRLPQRRSPRGARPITQPDRRLLPTRRRFVMGRARGGTVPRAASGSANSRGDPQRRSGAVISRNAARLSPGRRTDRAASCRFCPRRDGTQLGLLKLVAGMAGLGLDELVQRLTRKEIAIGRDGCHGAVGYRGVNHGRADRGSAECRREAEYERAKAERLVEFM